MPPLTNPRHEHFAQLIAAGETPTKAYTLAGYSEKGAHASAFRLQQNATTRARVEELTLAASERACEKAALDRVWVLDKLKTNVLRAMQEEQVMGRDGKPTGEYTFQGNVANRALELIGKELGMFVDRVKTETDVNVTDTSDSKHRIAEKLIAVLTAGSHQQSDPGDAD